MDWEDGLSLIQLAWRKDHEELLRERWIHGTQDSYQGRMSFDEFKARMIYKVETVDNQTPEQILSKVKKILDGGGSDGTI